MRSGTRKVHVLSTRNNPNADAFNLPLRLHRRALREMGVGVDFYFDVSERLWECDLLFLNSKWFRSWNGDRRARLGEFLGNARERVGRVLWFDTTDSTGTTQFEVLPHVDGYYKSQTLADRIGYLRPYYGRRVYTDFYHRQYGVADDDESMEQEVAREEDLQKIHTSWSSALGDHGYGATSTLYEKARGVGVPLGYSVRFTSADRPRSRDISCRFGRGHARNTVRFHRDRLAEALEASFGVVTEKVPKRDYWAELKDARIVASPFGWGEITLRDFHTFINGGALLKPDMSHVETWPPLYVEGQTYLGHRWDMADLSAKVEQLRSGRCAVELARNGQSTYRRYLLSREGHLEFARRVAAIVERHA